MISFRIKTSVFVLLLALCVNNLHEWLPHADETACEVCIHQSHDGFIEATDRIAISCEPTLLTCGEFKHQVTDTSNPLIEPTRGSPSLS